MFLLEGKLRRKSFLYLFKPYVIFHEHKLVRTQPPIIPHIPLLKAQIDYLL